MNVALVAAFEAAESALLAAASALRLAHTIALPPPLAPVPPPVVPTCKFCQSPDLLTDRNVRICRACNRDQSEETS